MARVSTYLNFATETEAAFTFYRSVFGGDFLGGITRFGDLPEMDGIPSIPEAERHLVMHIELELLGGHVLMGSDAPASRGFSVATGNHVHINLEPDSREETQRLFNALSDGGTVTMELQDTFWGAFYGSCTDRFGIQWMFNCPTQ